MASSSPRWILITLVSLTGSTVVTAADHELQFNREIRPILSAKCFACHGFDARKREANLRLDLPPTTQNPSDHPAIVPGDSAASEVWKRISSSDPDVVMPPPASHQELTNKEKETLRKWIDQGARYQQHWAFERPVKVEPPKVDSTGAELTPIDRFLQQRVVEAGLSPNGEAARETLIRRVAFTLTGLPPTLDEVAAYLADRSPNAYEAMVDRYLQSPRYGEEMGRHWLDVARYADTHGLHLDNEREMWAYRDWVIAAFNRNQPFDEFTVEQLAGDLLPNPTQDQLTATGFNRCNVTTSEGGSIESEFLYRYAVERASTTTQAWMALTGGCAVCHDHKYDPISTKEFYSLYAFFYSAADPAMDGNTRFTNPFISLATPEQTAKLQALKEQEARAQQSLDKVAGEQAIAAFLTGLEGAAEPIEQVWFDDLLPSAQRVSTTSRNKATWVLPGGEAPVQSGQRSLRQYGGDLYQDKFETVGSSWVIPTDAVIDVWVRTDPLEPPDAMMLELVTTRGVRRLVLGDNSKLAGGKEASNERLVRPLPTPGEWSLMTITAADWSLQAGDIVRSLSFEEFGGICYWDSLKVRGTIAPAAHPSRSFDAWWQTRKGQETTGVPAALQGLLKQGSPTMTELEGPASALQPLNSEANRQRATELAQLQQYYLAHVARPLTADWQAARSAYEAAVVQRVSLEDSIPGTFTFRDLESPRDSFVMERGQYDKPGEKVEPAVPAIFPALKLPAGRTRATRLDLARWLVSPEHPLTSRVAVNRFWQQVFGTGLVKTSDDFGSQGEPPSHPELLDWLALDFQQEGWNVKRLVKQMLMTAAFRQSAAVTAEHYAADPENRLLARGPRFRLDAEQVRDNALSVSGLLNLQMGGPGVKPYQPPNIWEPIGYANSNTRYFIQDHGEDLYRRSIYCFLKRTAPPPFMTNFDGPNREQFCARREKSNTPLQALQTLNDTQHVEAARAFAARLLKSSATTPAERIILAYQIVLSRRPAPDELELLTRTLSSWVERYQSDTAAAQQLIHVGESQPQVVATPVELAAYTLLANLVLNLDETLNRN